MDKNEIIGHYRGWLYRSAGSMLRHDSPELDDLAQEGWIAMWRALDTYQPDRGALPSYLTMRARYRMLDVVKNWNWTGAPSRREGRNKALRPDVLSLDEERGEGNTLADLLADTGNLEAIELAYHHGEILAALDRLTPKQREYVEARFWKGMNGREMSNDIFGYDPSGLWNSPLNGAKKKLKKDLGHLDTALAYD